METEAKTATLRNRRGGLALGNAHRWGDTLDGLVVLIDEIEEKGLYLVLEEADERGVEGNDLRKLLTLLSDVSKRRDGRASCL